MKTSRLVAKVVVDVDDEEVSKVNIYLRTGPLAIDANDRPGESIVRVPVDPVNAPIVRDGLCQCKLAAAAQQKENQG